ncbi:MAG TPA: DUF4384 domain-containing protein [Gemmatimonadales bacterium]|nr:DUF4384 domain-containing protein [Gemmatimonadales bacterium]
MLLALLLSLAPAVTQADGPAPITVKLNHEQFSRGDKARVYVQTARDGYLIVLHADPQARVRVLFPRDPTDDAFVRGGKRVEIRGRSDRDAFIIDAEDGAGTVLAAISSDPFTYDGFVLNGHWDYRSLGAGSVQDDPLAGLLDIVRRMSGENRFEYDAATYVVSNQIAGYGYGHGYGYSRYRLGLSFGYPYRFGYYDPFYDPFCYDPFWSWSARCYGSRYGLGYGYGYGFGFGYTYYPRRPVRFYRPFIVGGFGTRGDGGGRFVIPDRNRRDRFTPIEPRPRAGSVSRPSVAPRSRDAGVSRERPNVTRERPSAPRSRPSVSRGSSGGSRPAARPSSGGRRSGGGGGRRN